MPRRPAMTRQDILLVLCAPKGSVASDVAEALGLGVHQVDKVRARQSWQICAVALDFHRERRDDATPVYLKD